MTIHPNLIALYLVIPGFAPGGAPWKDGNYRTISAERPTLPGGRGIAGFGF